MVRNNNACVRLVLACLGIYYTLFLFGWNLKGRSAQFVKSHIIGRDNKRTNNKAMILGSIQQNFYTCNLQVGPLYLQAQPETSSIKIGTSPGYKYPTCKYRCSATCVKYGKNPI